MNDEALLYDRKALIERYEETLIRLAYLDMERLEAEQLQADIESGALGVTAAELDAMYERSLKRMARAIEHGERKRLHKRRAGYSLPRAAQVAVCLLLVLALGGITTVAAVPIVRARVLRLLMNIERKYTELSMVEDEAASFDVPAGWRGDYFMSYIPEGFELGGMDHLPSTLDDVYYLDDQERVLYFTVLFSGAEANIDTEGARIETVFIHGNQGMLSVKQDRVNIAWAVTDRYFILNYDGDAETALQIAESVRILK